MAHLLVLRSKIILVSFSALSFFCFFFLSVFSANIDVAEVDYMLKLLNALTPPPSDWSNDTNMNMCNWSGVGCDYSSSADLLRVASINLTSTSLRGTLPSGLNSLLHLQSLDLSNNTLSGPLLCLTGVAMLVDVNLAHNNFTSVPKGCFNGLPNLQTLNLSHNIHLAPWTFPTNLAQSSKLNTLDLVATNLMGTLPDIFHSLPTLQTLLLSSHNLSGALPMSLARSQVATLWLNNPVNHRGLSGAIDVLSSMTNLSQVWLQGNMFAGDIPDLSNCTKLLDLQLRGNRLVGRIPESLTTLSQLEVVDVSYNNLTGNIPRFSRKVRLNATGNAFLRPPRASGPSPSPDSGHSHRRRPTQSKTSLSPLGIAGISAAGAGVIVISVVVIYNYKRCLILVRKIMFKESTFVDNNFEDFIKSYGPLPLKRYSYFEVKRMTNSFRDKLGQGGYGIVYRSSLIDGRQLAIKVLGESKGSGEEFINEVASISRTSHVNIVSLLGFCYEMNKRALIYEFMPNGSLDKFIYKKGTPNAICDLDWKTLFQIAIGIARGLEYLHRGCNTRILHLDIKPQNILLDEDFCPKISDFGLAKICQKKESIVSILGPRGTIGYIAPEVCSRTYGGVSHKSDVYSYGMLILEVVGGRENYDSGGSHTSEMYFPDWIYKDLEQGNIPSSCVAKTEEENSMIMKITLVSLWCIQPNPSNRPSMSKVVEMLEGPLQSVPYPPKPILHSPERSLLQFSNISCSNIDETNSIIVEESGSIKENEFI